MMSRWRALIGAKHGSLPRKEIILTSFIDHKAKSIRETAEENGRELDYEGIEKTPTSPEKPFK